MPLSASATVRALLERGALAACVAALAACSSGSTDAVIGGGDDGGAADDAGGWTDPGFGDDAAAQGIVIEGGPVLLDSGAPDDSPGGGDGGGDACAGRSPVCRWFNPSTGEHFFTIDPKEAPPGFTLESSVAFYLDGPGAGVVPFYRCYSSTLNRHLYTTSGACDGTVGFAPESILGYVGTDGCGGAATVYRAFDAKTYDHFYTASPDEADNAVAVDGYVLQGAYSAWSSP